MKVVEIFNSIEGEGKRVGSPCTFIRLHGCNLNCSYCDSRYACEGDEYTVMSIEEIIQKVEELGCNKITVTGGEPLLHPGIDHLLYELFTRDYWTNVETNGSMIPLNIPCNCGEIFCTMDYKSLSSGMNSKMLKEAFRHLKAWDVLKCVVSDMEDLDDFLNFVEELNPRARIFISPVFGKIEPVKLVEYIQQHKLYNWNVQVQLHKIIWDPEQKGV